MPRLLFHADPSCEDGRFAIPTHVGDCIDVLPDGRGRGKLVLLHCVVVDTDMPEEECIALFMASGVPDEVQQAVTDAEAAELAADEDLKQTAPKDVILVALAQSRLKDAQEAVRVATEAASPRLWPWRRVKLDLAVVPPENVQSCCDFKAAIAAVKEDADHAEAAMFAAQVTALRLSPSKAAKILKPDATKATGFEIVGSDRIADELRDAERVGRALVEDPIVDAHVAPRPVFLDADTLRKAAVMK